MQKEQLIDIVKQAEMALETGNLRQAHYIFSEILNNLNDDPQAQSMLHEKFVQLYTKVPDFTKALDHLQKLITLTKDNSKYYVLAGDACVQLKKYQDAQKYYQQAIAQNKEPGLLALINAKVAYCYLSAGDVAKAASVNAKVLEKDPGNLLGVLNQTEEMVHNGKYLDALPQVLQLLTVLQQNEQQLSLENERNIKLLVKISQQAGCIDMIHKLLTVDAKVSPEAIDLLATVLHTNGSPEQAVELMQVIISEQTELKYIVKYIHFLEACAEPELALKTAIDFLTSNPDEACFGLSSSKFIEQLSGNAVTLTPEELNFEDDNYDFLALIFTVIKLKYSLKQFDNLKNAVALVNQFIPSGSDLHLTMIRNENSYFNHITRLITRLPSELNPDIKTLPVIGDSHCLSTGWHNATIHGTEYQMQPQLVTGCKIWHLRPESNFYTKTQLYKTLEKLPENSDVMFILGEIDCREGILMAVEKMRYENIEAAIEKLVIKYWKILAKIEKEFPLGNIFIHPAPPVLNETRFMIKLFNQEMTKRAKQFKQANPNSKICYLDFANQLLKDDFLAEDYVLDGTHLNPKYLELLK